MTLLDAIKARDAEYKDGCTHEELAHLLRVLEALEKAIRMKANTIMNRRCWCDWRENGHSPSCEQMNAALALLDVEEPQG